MASHREPIGIRGATNRTQHARASTPMPYPIAIAIPVMSPW